MAAILVRDTSAPTVATRIVVRAGAAHDPVDHAGTAHLLEHLMFGGTSELGTTDYAAERPHLRAMADLTTTLAGTDDPEERSALERLLVEESEQADVFGLPNEVFRLLDALGATGVNATTGLDATNYIATVPATALEPWAVLEAERFSDPVFRSFVNERRAVEEELALRTACGCGRTQQEEHAVLFRGHPYATPLGGTPTSLAQATVADVARFFDRFYVPGNMAVVLVGDLDVESTFDLLVDTLGAIPEGPVPAVALPDVLPAAIGRVAVPAASVHEFELAWALVGMEPGDLEAVMVAARAIRARTSSETGWTPAITIEPLVGAGILRFRGSNRNRIESVDAVRSAIREISRRGVSRETIDAARIRAWVDRLEELERQDRQAEDLASGWVHGEGPRVLWQSLRHLYDIDPDRVADAVERLIPPDDFTSTTGPVVPAGKEEGSPVTAVDVDDPRASALYRENPGDPAAPAVSGVATGGGGLVAERGRSGRRGEEPAEHPVPGDVAVAAGRPAPPGAVRGPRCLASARRPGSGAPSRRRRRGPACRRLWLGLCVDRAEGAGVVGRGGRCVGREQLAHGGVARGAGAVHRGPPIEALGRADVASRAVRAPALVPALPRLGAPRAPDASQLAALHWLGSLAPDVQYAGPHDASVVAALFPAVTRTEPDPPEPIVPQRPRVELWDTIGVGVRLVRVGEPYDPDHEGLYRLYEHWLDGPTGAVMEELRFGTGRVYTAGAALRRGRWSGSRTSSRCPSPRGGTPGSATWSTSRTASPRSWRRTHSPTPGGSGSSKRPGCTSSGIGCRSGTRRGRFGAAMDRGLAAETNEVAFAQLQHVTKRDFEGFLAREAATPPTWVITGPKLDPARLERPRGRRGRALTELGIRFDPGLGFAVVGKLLLRAEGG